MHVAQRTKIAEKVHKTPFVVSPTNFELNGFNALIWVPRSPSESKKLELNDRSIQIHEICGKKQNAFLPLF